MDLRKRYQETINKLAGVQSELQMLQGELRLLAEQINAEDAAKQPEPAPNRAERRRRGRPAAQANGAAQPNA